MKTDAVLRDAALLIARLGLGTSIAAHGAQKMFGMFEGPGLEGAASHFEKLGFHPGRTYVQAAAGTEMAAGTLMVLGAGGPLGPALLLSTMIVAAETVHRKNGYFAGKQGVELNTLYALGAVLLANAGNGNFSVDRVMGLERKLGPTAGWIALAGGVAGAVMMLKRRKVMPPAPNQIRVETGSTEPAAATS